MTFQVGTWAVDGNQIDAVQARQMLYGCVLGSQGTVGHLDCIVSANSPATAGIIIGAGTVIVNGAESGNQFQAYFASNIGTDTTLTVAATGGSPRSDMIIARAEDPTWSGSPWGNPASGQIVFPRVLSNVGAGATQVPGGFSAIPLARIDMPASTSVVQSSYIHDLRQVANPQRSTQMFSAAGPGSPANTTAGTTQIQWPPGASWSVQIPNYATQCIMFFQVNEVGYNSGAGNGVARGYFWVAVGASVLAPVIISPLSLFSINATTGPGRHVLAGSGPPIFGMNIPASIRGTTQTFQFAQYADGSNTGTLYADEGSSSVLILEFFQNAALS